MTPRGLLDQAIAKKFKQIDKQTYGKQVYDCLVEFRDKGEITLPYMSRMNAIKIIQKCGYLGITCPANKTTSFKHDRYTSAFMDGVI